ncbi:Proteasome assembly chaperone 2 [Plasmodiophora brassicae]
MALVGDGGVVNALGGLRGYTFVWPVVSVGNVGQLCVDVLIATEALGFEKVGVLSDPAVVPLVGYRQTRERSVDLTFALELFVSHGERVAVVQQRSPVIEDLHDEFGQRVAEWLACAGARRVILVGSTPAYRRADRDLQSGGGQVVCAASPPASSSDLAISKLQWARVSPDLFEHLQPDDGDMDAWALPAVGTGCARQLFAACQARDLEVAALLAVVDEGDNAIDGLQHAGRVMRLVGRLQGDDDDEERRRIDWQTPAEWALVFGGPHNPDLYL